MGRITKLRGPSRSDIASFFNEYGEAPPVKAKLGQDEVEGLRGFFADLDFRLTVLQTTKRELNKQAASDFNVFGLIDPDENKVSDVVAMLLDPKGVHGQQDLFLRLFIEKLGITPAAVLGEATVSREALTHQLKSYLRRIDILVRAIGFALAIENKVDAPEQEDQLRDCYAHLQNLGVPEYALVFLTPDGRAPKSIPNALAERLVRQTQLFCLGYQSVASWLTVCRQRCESDKVRHFLADFITYLQSRPIDEADAPSESQ